MKGITETDMTQTVQNKTAKIFPELTDPSCPLQNFFNVWFKVDCKYNTIKFKVLNTGLMFKIKLPPMAFTHITFPLFENFGMNL